LIAVADGNAGHRNTVAQAAQTFYDFTEYADSVRALAALRVVQPNVLLVGEELPPLGGFEMVRRLRLDDNMSKIPVIMVINREADAVVARQCGADAYLVKPYRLSALQSAIAGLVNAGVEKQWEVLPQVQRQALKGTVEIYNTISDVLEKGEPVSYAVVSDACAPLVEAVASHDFKAILNGVKDHDNYSYAHSMRVATLLTLFGNTIGLSADDQLLLASGGLLHDVGKMSIPHEVLNKPGRLTEDEFVVMKSHVTASSAHLRLNPDIPKGIITIAEQHHEKLDGTGYPHGLKGSELNTLARMASIVDVFSALTDRRVYKPAMPAEKALGIMTNEMGGNHLDNAFLGLFREMLLDAVGEMPDEPPANELVA
jgi:putative nucleotidyltransferase with HDIG domain